MYFPYFVIISTWTLVGVLNLKKLEFLSPKDALYQVWLKLAQRFLSEKIFLISLMYFRYFVFTFLCKKAGPFIWKNWNPLTKDALCQVWLKLPKRFWRRRRKCEKFTTTPTTSMMTDNRQILIRKANQSWRSYFWIGRLSTLLDSRISIVQILIKIHTHVSIFNTISCVDCQFHL